MLTENACALCLEECGYLADAGDCPAVAAHGRVDVVAPDTSLEGSIRGGKGNRLQAVRGFQKFPAVAS